ncbi:hypothetical protein [Achromobacter insuavis]|uniref:Uncharacterized protein n=1 Tax=Achromobacter insuavis AXX-A TaxID=1003200 RepID=F7T9H4_9BURK|nr:hypothetical protein [Achromobacter insuavis]EGP43134.1 hypothetical protein AXXA_28100 [Achromobacter insuavis AXX-A]
MQSNLILTTAQAQAVYSAMCALNNLGRVGGSVIIPKEPDQRDEPRVSWNFLGVTVHQDLTFHKEFYADQSAFAAAYGLDASAPEVTTQYTPGIGWQYVTQTGRHGNFETEAAALTAGRAAA